MIRQILSVYLLLSASISYAEIYKWVDEQGKVHYGDKPVDNSETLDISTEKSGNQNSLNNRRERQRKLTESLEEDRVEKQAAAEKKKKERQKNKRNCAVAQQRLKGYERAGYLYGIDKDGKKVIRSNEERQKATDKLRDKIKKYCK